MRFRSKPVEIDAIQWFTDGDHPAVKKPPTKSDVTSRHVLGAQGWSHVHTGDWIIAEPRGDGYYPCNPDVFAAKYEPVDEPKETV
jgi:hypothetical protein